ncbi:MAG: DUF4411 family protein [Fimbriimonadaceae bacterium]
MKATYVVDTSALMDWHDRFYPPDVFATLVERVDELVRADRFLSVELVREEIGIIGSIGLRDWARMRKSIFDPTANHLPAALAVEGAYPALKDATALYVEADAYVIAMAQMRTAIVVTAETPASHKRKPKRSMYIPDVCAALGLPCISNLGMMRREGWKI